ncbi:MAG: single-strand binding protein single-strand DNA-binding protein [Candidatus Taylorbacteria bacterium]|nr:single-strand binding protein single-strand DNA-binding protein [Candidatus Taylorbacteria bacterium]
MYLNKAMLYGNLTKDPEIKALPSGIKVASFGLATNRSYKDKNGVKQEATEYHNIVSFGKPAELISQYMKKGNPIFVEGRIQTRSWDDKDGSKKYRTEIIVENFQFGPKAMGGGGSYTPSAPKAEESTGPRHSTPADDIGSEIQYPNEEINIEDIPF